MAKAKNKIIVPIKSLYVRKHRVEATRHRSKRVSNEVPKEVQLAPRMMCWKGLKCKQEGCGFMHPSDWQAQWKKKCRYGLECYREGCLAVHPLGWQRRSAPPCRFGGRCERPDCGFEHPARTLRGGSKMVFSPTGMQHKLEPVMQHILELEVSEYLRGKLLHDKGILIKEVRRRTHCAVSCGKLLRRSRKKESARMTVTISAASAVDLEMGREHIMWTQHVFCLAIARALLAKSHFALKYERSRGHKAQLDAKQSVAEKVVFFRRAEKTKPPPPQHLDEGEWRSCIADIFGADDDWGGGDAHVLRRTYFLRRTGECDDDGSSGGGDDDGEDDGAGVNDHDNEYDDWCYSSDEYAGYDYLAFG